jgi:hypothetical protein
MSNRPFYSDKDEKDCEMTKNAIPYFILNSPAMNGHLSKVGILSQNPAQSIA